MFSKGESRIGPRSTAPFRVPAPLNVGAHDQGTYNNCRGTCAFASLDPQFSYSCFQVGKAVRKRALGHAEFRFSDRSIAFPSELSGPAARWQVNKWCTAVTCHDLIEPRWTSYSRRPRRTTSHTLVHTYLTYCTCSIRQKAHFYLGFTPLIPSCRRLSSRMFSV